MNLVAQNYGKQRVRVLKVLRDAARHEVKELTCGVRLEGDFASSYTAADNGKVVPTDTLKNTVQALAHQHLGRATEPFALLLALHLVDRYPQIERATVETWERRWVRLVVDGGEHDHAFRGGDATPVSRVVAADGREPEVESGIEDLLLLKSTQSGFAGFPRCEYTTLPETGDRILSTLVNARWRWSTLPADFEAANGAALDALLRVFATTYSPSVQATIAEMAEALFAAVPEIREVSLALPNKHYLPANLTPFHLDGTGVTFVPTDEPHGQIEATFSRA
jgi:urate oxidase